MSKVTITVEDANPVNARKKAEAASVLIQKLSTDTLVRLAYVVKNDPEKTALALTFL